LYNNNSSLMKQLNIYSSGLQGTSPPPRVVLQGLSAQGQSRPSQNTPIKGNHALLADLEARRKFPMEESSVSSEDEDDGDSEVESFHVQTMVAKVPVTFNLSKPVVEHKKSSSDSSSHSEDSSVSRPTRPPGYDEAVHRNNLLKAGLSPDSGGEGDVETARQREASLRAKQLYEQSMRQYQESFPLQPTPRSAQRLDSHEEVSSSEETESVTESEEEEPRYNPHKIYEESLKRFQEEQNKHPPLQGTNISLSNSKGGATQRMSLSPGAALTPGSSSLKRSSSDVGNGGHLSRSGSSSSRNSSNDSTPTRRPTQPPPYNDPPPYKSRNTESSPSGAKRHLFPRAGESVVSERPSAQTDSPKTVKSVSPVRDNSAVKSSNDSIAQSIPRQRDSHILVSNRDRKAALDATVRSAQMDYNTQYRANVTNIRACNSQSGSTVSTVSQQPSGSYSSNVFKPRASSVEPQQMSSNPRTSSQGPVSYRNPQMTRSSASSANIAQSQPALPPQTRDRRGSLDASRPAAQQKELPWSVKRLSNIFDTVKVEGRATSPAGALTRPLPAPQSARSTPVHTDSPSSGLHHNDTFRSSSSSNSSSSVVSIGYSGAGRSPLKGYTKFGPQARDSFSSNDSECSCRFSLSCNLDNGEELADPTLTDITYV